MLRVLRGETRAVAMVGNRIRCLTAIISKHSGAKDANQVWPSFKLFSTKTRPLLQDAGEQSGSAKLGLEEALGLFNSLVLTKPRPPVSEFDKVLQAISSSHQGSLNLRAAVVIALLKGFRFWLEFSDLALPQMVLLGPLCLQGLLPMAVANSSGEGLWAGI